MRFGPSLGAAYAYASAINHHLRRSGWVELTSGVYTAGRIILPSGSRLTVESGATLKAHSGLGIPVVASDALILAVDAVGVKVEGAGRVETEGSGVWFTRGSDHTVEGVTFHRATPGGDAVVSQLRGVRATDCTGVTVDGVTVENYDLGIEMWRDSGGATVRDCIVRGPYGISLDDSKVSAVTGSVVEGVEGETMFNTGIELAATVGGFVENNSVTIPASAVDGLRLAVLVGRAGSGVQGSDDAVVRGNTFVGGRRCWITRSSDVLFEQNTCNNQTDRGILISSDLDEANLSLAPVVNVTVRQNTVRSSAGRGIEVQAFSGLVADNDVRDCAGAGVYAVGLSNEGALVTVGPNTSVNNGEPDTVTGVTAAVLVP